MPDEISGLARSELITNEDGSIYHLNLLPGDIAETIITVGDPDRVIEVSKHFNEIEVIKQKREFTTHTGTFRGKRLSVISTGIGAGNIDIFMNEIDALVNVDLEKRIILDKKRQLNIIRLGTSGSLHPDILPGDLVISSHAIGFDAAMAFYEVSDLPSFRKFLQIGKDDPFPNHYFTAGSTELMERFTGWKSGITISSPGFYAAQNRSIRLASKVRLPFEKLHTFEYDGHEVTNMEMETSCIYALASLMGHRALSVNCILANRLEGTFSSTPHDDVELMIGQVLDILAPPK